ncbi:uncharacterized protein MYCGRDRAFT_94705 [Zymoseptoria tritici IPO323]|uniref:Uncharacterized protein n=1 Tax=Zymoseptoria tritici (strain CBS 115943 / IPO323) TaxID=336722 RepID=F9XGT2_ZYMTI|nr:uncharacterized protein MYCGRDRAFT_94705 [Zymoseptoria tritici IPO323]EGP85817.1 hypothetical protein MYCGRDRAFT_94705 [Zymoseptoria tritici IPO323]
MEIYTRVPGTPVSLAARNLNISPSKPSFARVSKPRPKTHANNQCLPPTDMLPEQVQSEEMANTTHEHPQESEEQKNRVMMEGIKQEKEEIAKREAAVKKREQLLDIREMSLVTRDMVMKHREQKASTNELDQDLREEELDEREEDLTAREEAVAQSEQEVAGRSKDMDIRHLSQDLRDDDLDEREKFLFEREKAVAKRQKEMSVFEDWLTLEETQSMVPIGRRAMQILARVEEVEEEETAEEEHIDRPHAPAFGETTNSHDEESKLSGINGEDQPDEEVVEEVDHAAEVEDTSIAGQAVAERQHSNVVSILRWPNNDTTLDIHPSNLHICFESPLPQRADLMPWNEVTTNLDSTESRSVSGSSKTSDDAFSDLADEFELISDFPSPPNGVCPFGTIDIEEVRGLVKPLPALPIGAGYDSSEQDSDNVPAQQEQEEEPGSFISYSDSLSDIEASEVAQVDTATTVVIRSPGRSFLFDLGHGNRATTTGSVQCAVGHKMRRIKGVMDLRKISGDVLMRR